MFKLTIKDHGDRKLDRMLRKLGPVSQRRIIRPAANKAMAPVVSAAKSNLTRMGAVDTGQLRKSIGKKTKSIPRAGVVVVIVGPRLNFKDSATGRNPANYAHLVELGFDARGTKIPARPFFKEGIEG